MKRTWCKLALSIAVLSFAAVSSSYADEVDDLEGTVLPMEETGKKIMEELVLPDSASEQAILRSQFGLETANMARMGEKGNMGKGRGEEMRDSRSERNDHGEEMRLTRDEDDAPEIEI